jgi:hypothetical protein
LSGWAFGQQTWRPFESGYLRIEPGGLQIPLAYGLERADVVTALRLPRFSAVGYAVTFSSDVLQQGDNVLSLEFTSKHGDRVVVTPTAAVPGRGGSPERRPRCRITGDSFNRRSGDPVYTSGVTR